MSPPAAPEWTDLGGGIRVRQSRAYWMNSALLMHTEHAILVDPGVLPSELDDIARAVAEAKPDAITLLLTHAHWDHVLGRPWWPKAEVIAHDAFAAELKGGRARVEQEAARLAAEHGERWPAPFAPFRPGLAVSGLHFTKIGPWRVVFRDAFGHCDSQLSMHLPEARVLFAADMLSDIEIPMLNRPAADYRATLEALVPLAAHGAIETLVPGHGSIARGADAVRERLARDLGYLEALESRARDAKRRGLDLERAQEELSAMEYTGKRAAYSMVDVHRRNVRHAYEAAGPRPRAASKRRAASKPRAR